MRVILTHAVGTPGSSMALLKDADRGNMTGTRCRLVSANRERSYLVRLAPGISAGNVAELVQVIDGRKSLLVTTPTVARLYANDVAKRLIQSGVDVSMVILECAEQSKTLVEVERLCQECFRVGL